MILKEKKVSSSTYLIKQKLFSSPINQPQLYFNPLLFFKTEWTQQVKQGEEPGSVGEGGGRVRAGRRWGREEGGEGEGGGGGEGGRERSGEGGGGGEEEGREGGGEGEEGGEGRGRGGEEGREGGGGGGEREGEGRGRERRGGEGREEEGGEGEGERAGMRQLELGHGEHRAGALGLTFISPSLPPQKPGLILRGGRQEARGAGHYAKEKSIPRGRSKCIRREIFK